MTGFLTDTSCSDTGYTVTISFNPAKLPTFPVSEFTVNGQPVTIPFTITPAAGQTSVLIHGAYRQTAGGEVVHAEDYLVTWEPVTNCATTTTAHDTTTTAAATTTTAAATTTSQGATTTSGATTTTAVATTPPATLPPTGGGPGPLPIGAVGLLLVGALSVMGTRRRAHAR